MMQLKMMKLILAHPRALSCDYSEALNAAIFRNHIETVKILLSNPHCDPSDSDNSAIKTAAKYDHIEIVKLLLLDPRVNPYVNNNSPLRKAIKYECDETVEFLEIELKRYSDYETRKEQLTLQNQIRKSEKELSALKSELKINEILYFKGTNLLSMDVLTVLIESLNLRIQRFQKEIDQLKLKLL